MDPISTIARQRGGATQHRGSEFKLCKIKSERTLLVAKQSKLLSLMSTYVYRQ